MTTNSEETKDLVVIDNSFKPLVAFYEEKGLDPLIEQIKLKISKEPVDMTTKAGRTKMRSFAKFGIAGSKNFIQGLSDQLREEGKARDIAIRDESKRMRDEVDALRDDFLKPLIEFETKEKDRLAAHEDRLFAMANTANFDGFAQPDVEELKETIRTLNLLYTVAFDNSAQDWEEFANKAASINETTLNRLNGMMAGRIKADQEAAELKRLQDEETERKAQAERDRIAKEAAEKATADAEAKAEADKIETARVAKIASDKVIADKVAAEKEAKEAKQALIDADIKAESDRQEAAERERKAKVQAETDRVAAEKKAEDDKEAAVQAERKRQEDKDAAQKAEDDRRAADQVHRVKINNEARTAIADCGIDGSPEYRSDTAKAIITAIAQGNIPHVKISY